MEITVTSIFSDRRGQIVLHRHCIGPSLYLWATDIMYTNDYCHSTCGEIHSNSNLKWHFEWGAICTWLCMWMPACTLMCLWIHVCFMSLNLAFRCFFFLSSNCFPYTDINVLFSVCLSGSWLDQVSAPKQITPASNKAITYSQPQSVAFNFISQTPLTFNIYTSITIQLKSNKSFYWMNCPVRAHSVCPHWDTLKKKINNNQKT